MGRVSAVDLAEGVDKIFQKFKLTILREESTYSLIYYETEWMMREPHPSEQAQGATQARDGGMRVAGIGGRRMAAPGNQRSCQAAFSADLLRPRDGDPGGDHYPLNKKKPRGT
jgi:hypothetical protein